MKLRAFFAWFDFWIGAYYDVGHRALYVCPLPMFVLRFEFAGEKDQRKHRTDRANPHPEDFCDKCGRPNIVWFTPSVLWNKFVRAVNAPEILCPVCFVQLAETAGELCVWEVAPEGYNTEEGGENNESRRKLTLNAPM